MSRLTTICGALLIALSTAQAGAHFIVPGPVPLRVLHGAASWYGPGFQGRLTASGEHFDQTELTAAHKKLPFDTRVRVTNEANGKAVVVRINDRGPFVGKRIIDLSRRAAERIGLLQAGVGPVKLEVLPRI